MFDLSSATFQLSDKFIKKYARKSPAWGPLGYITYKRTYARSLNAVHERYQKLGEQYKVGTSEEFWLTLVRVVEGCYRIQESHCKALRLPWSPWKAQKSAQTMFELMWNFKFLPPGRGLWMMGTPYIEKKLGAPLNNCAFVSTLDLKTSFAGPFCFLMDMSMLGVGVGGDTQGAGTILVKEPRIAPGVHEVTDDREGWVEIVRRVLDAYVGADTIPEKIDYGKVRPLGSAINGFGGVASGPEPLDELVQSIQEVLNPLIGEYITSTAIVDIFNLIGRCVVSGNVRRSAEIMFGDPDDEEFFDLKNKEMWPEEVKHHRWASNNSISAQIGMNYDQFAARTGKNGEPGYLWLENARRFSRMCDPEDNKDYGAHGANPCVEQTLESYEMCCLVETFPSRHETYDEYQLTLKFAYLYAKTVTLMPTHDERTNAVAMRNRRIGCSQSGIVQAFQKHGRREMFRWCDEGFNYLAALDKIYARWLCVPESIKKTSIKPSGTISLLPGVTPGIHYPHSAYYFRVIRFASDSPLLKRLERAGYKCVPLDPQKEPNTTAVYFAVKEEHFDRSKNDVSLWEQLENAAQYQAYWADNQVSCTVTFKEHEAAYIPYALQLYETRLKGISFLPLEEHGYEHAPYQEISEKEYNDYTANLKKLKLNNIETEVEDKFCDGETCEIKL
jgi:hypothetical protein